MLVFIDVVAEVEYEGYGGSAGLRRLMVVLKYCCRAYLEIDAMIVSGTCWVGMDLGRDVGDDWNGLIGRASYE